MRLARYLGLDPTFGWFGMGYFARQSLGCGMPMTRPVMLFAYYQYLSDLGWGQLAWGSHPWCRFNVVDRTRPKDSLYEDDVSIDLGRYNFAGLWDGDATRLGFAFAQLSRVGVIGKTGPYLEATFDANGDILILVSNNPQGLQATVLAEGKVGLSWGYSQIDQPAAPTGFKVQRYVGGTWNDILTVAYRAGAKRYAETTIAYSNGTVLRIRVRAYRTVASVDYYTQNNDWVEVTVDAQAPNKLTGVAILGNDI